MQQTAAFVVQNSTMPNVSGMLSDAPVSLSNESDCLALVSHMERLNSAESLETGDALPSQAKALSPFVPARNTQDSFIVAEQIDMEATDRVAEEEEAQCQQQPESEEVLVSFAAA